MNVSSSSKPLVVHSSDVLRDGGSIRLTSNRGVFYIDNRVASKRAGLGNVIWTAGPKGGFGKPVGDKALAEEIRNAYHNSYVRRYLNHA